MKLGNNKKFKYLAAATILASGLFMASPSTLAAKQFTDLDSDPSHATAVKYFNSKGIFDYKEGNKLNGHLPVTRAEASQFIRSFHAPDEVSRIRNGVEYAYYNDFKDINSNTPFYEDIIWCYERGFFVGDGNDNFNPNQTLTRAQMAKVVYKAWVPININDFDKDSFTFKDVSKDHWAYKYINILGSYEVSLGDGKGNFMPNDKVTLNQFASFMYRMSNAKYPGYTKSN